MNSIIQHLSTILTLASSEFVNTGNRVLDNSIIGLITFLIIQIVNFVADDWKRLYNCVIFHLYNMKEHPLDMNGVPFVHTDEYEKDAFFDYVSMTYYLDFFTSKYQINSDNDYMDNLLYTISNFIIKNKFC